MPTRDSAPPMDVAAPFAGSVDYCQKPGCDNPLPDGHHVTRKYCDEHQPRASKKTGKVGRDKAPHVVVELGSGPTKKGADKELDAVEEKAKQIAQMMAALIMLAGQHDDAADITNGTPGWAKSVRDLAEHEKWLRKIAAGGETSARTMAWVAFAIATVSMVLPILIRHKALPDNIAQLAATFLGQTEAMVGEASDDAKVG